MSTSDAVLAVAETTVHFGHGGEVAIKLSTEHGSFPQERLSEVLAASRKDTIKDLEVMSHVSETSDYPSVKHSKREFSLVFSDIHFGLEVVVTVGRLNAPVENVYHIVQTWVLMAIIHFCGLDVLSRTGAPAAHQDLLIAGQQLEISSLVCISLAVREG